ncbi:hypothetical protein [Kitasatospora sp. NBC_01302]|uniref:hypothetical protein n=1 Tax=Kitasatospora sp. NBC_01302 TaxID=2903575 RepID=UPI002E11C22B|nr:hypothetical protein OG294_40945 [Kitasatospora sp. NBC_01302]
MSVEEILPGGRRRVLDVRALPEGGPAGALVGTVLVHHRQPRPLVPAPRPAGDDLLAVAVAVGVVA